MVRVGFGTDSHSFDENKDAPLILGAVKISDSDGLNANSDGDVILHAIFNALSQACGGESLGYYADPLCEKGITDSSEYLKIALRMVNDIGCRIGNIGVMVEARRPRIPIEDVRRMKRAIADLCGISEQDVGITFTSGEGLTSFGKGKGILAQAIVTLVG
ncbi:MAG TPA: 2-C-methyl-D-erythritol 2,4-cyclodiphosphate synthase [Spirochaetota bacterium]|nr:2-C-methyl-D-erythritol 2,4-cyclodiphosphate synthase [Spirochaetota bacterium]